MAQEDLITICNNVMDGVGLGRPGTVIGNTDINAKRLLAFASQSGKQLQRKFDWTILQREHTFNTADGTASYSLPDDFGRMIDDTTWDRASYWKYRGRMNPSDWQRIKSGLVNAAQLQKGFRIKADTRVNKFFVDPTPAAVEAQVYEYITDEWCIDSANAGGLEDWNADTDLPLFDSLLIELDVKWRILNQMGVPYLEEKNDFLLLYDDIIAKDGGTKILDMNQPDSNDFDIMSNTPDGSYTL